MNRLAVVAAAAAAIIGASWPLNARADVVVNINKSAQSMSVSVDGSQTYTWAVSTGVGGGPQSGNYRAQRMERTWYSRKYNWSPMPHAIFFHEGYAIHGTAYVSRLGTRASHGCVRLHPSNAATLYALVQREGMANLRINIH